MGTLKQLTDRFARWLRNMSLVRKTVLLYSLIILIPVSLAGYFFYSDFQRSVDDELRAGLEQNVEQMARDIGSRVDRVQNVADILAGDSKIRYFLSLSRKPDRNHEKLYYDYEDTALPLLQHAMYFNSFDIQKISIFIDSSENAEVDERSGIVFSDTRLAKFPWYAELKAGKKDTVWLPAHPINLYSPYPSGADPVVYTLVRKIYATTGGAYLGVVTLDVRRDDMLSGVIGYNGAGEGGRAYVVGSDGSFVLFPAGLDRAREQSLWQSHAGDGQGHFTAGSGYYVRQAVGSLGITLVCRSDLSGINAAARETELKFLLVFLLGLVLLIGLFYLSMRGVFHRLKGIVATMNQVAKGRFDLRVPVDRGDEVGQLAGDFNILIERINALVNRVVEKEIAQKDAQLLALQYQINPHFIYNMIDVFRMRMVLLNDQEAAAAITDFGKLLRHNIGNRSKYSTLKDEAEIARKYIGLQMFRHPDRIRLTVDLPEELEPARIIRFLLQPIVENSIRHGLAAGGPVLGIALEFRQEHGHILIRVVDNGRGIPEERLTAINDAMARGEEDDGAADTERGIGLTNINRRLVLFYGAQYHIRLESEPGVRTSVELRIPRE